MTKSDSVRDNPFSIDRRTALKLASVAGLGAVFSGTALADDSSDIETVDPERPPAWERDDGIPDVWAEDLWFVEFADEPTSRGGDPAAHANERAQLRREANRENVSFTERRDFNTLWNGLSVRADLADAIVMSGLDSVSRIYPVALFDRPEPDEKGPELDTALSMTGADRAQSEIGVTGEGYSVAVVDTGIDYNHPDLGGDGDLNVVYTAESEEDRTLTDQEGNLHKRITHGWDYVGAGFDASDPDADEPDPNPDPMDPHGHGTHVAGIAGANAADEDGVTGVAPGVTFGAYKIFDVGSSTAEIIVEALEDAYDDGMDIVNMSLGASLAWGQEYPTTAASNELAEEGVVVVNSAGNDGALGTWSMSAPANAHDIISVASAENVEFEALAFNVDDFEDPVPYMELSGAELPPTEGESEPLALPAESVEEGELGYFGCNPEDWDDFPEGYVALVERGHCTFAAKYLNAIDAGATGVVIFNNLPGLFAGTILDAGVEGIWGACINQADGQALAGLVEQGEEVTLYFTDEKVTVPNPQGGLLSGFSSYGQEVELEFGPSVTAPGGLIMSTYPLEQGGYAMASGTSMSAPHVAGAVALLLEAEPDIDPFEVRDRLQNTAEPMPWSLNPGLGFLDHTFRQGAGMVQIDRVIESNQIITPGQISVGDLAAGDTITRELELTNNSDEAITYELDHEPAMPTGWSTFEPGFPVGFDEEAGEFFLFPAAIDTPDDITVGAGESIEVSVAFSPPFGNFDVVPNHQFGGYLVLSSTDNHATELRIPYCGLDGNYLRMPLFKYYDYDIGGFVEQNPRLSRIVEGEDDEVDYEPVEPGHTFRLGKGDYPVVEAFFGHFPQTMRMYAVDQERDREYPLMESHYLPRSPGPDEFYPFVWPGTTMAGRSEQVRPGPAGTYTLRVEVLRAMGDPEDDAHWETWESPEFELQRERGRSSVGGRAPASGDD